MPQTFRNFPMKADDTTVVANTKPSLWWRISSRGMNLEWKKFDMPAKWWHPDEFGKHVLSILHRWFHWPGKLWLHTQCPTAIDKVLFQQTATGKFGALDVGKEFGLREHRRYYIGIVGHIWFWVQNFSKLAARTLDIQDYLARSTDRFSYRNLDIIWEIWYLIFL